MQYASLLKHHLFCNRPSAHVSVLRPGHWRCVLGPKPIRNASSEFTPIPRINQVEKSFNIIVDDLHATLQAHREWNRANVYRKVAYVRQARAGEPAQVTSNASSTRRSTLLGKTAGELELTNISSWPADSVQTLKRQGIISESEIIASQEKIAAQCEILEYNGMPQPVQGEWFIRSERADVLLRPWLPYLGQSAGETPKQRLSQEIQAFEAYMRLTPAEEANANLALSDVSRILASSCNVQIVGSRSRDLASPLSDLDLSLRPRNPNKFNLKNNNKTRGGDKTRRSAIGLLRFAQRCLQRSRVCEHSQIKYGRVPIIEATHIGTQTKVQLQGPTQVDLQNELMKEYMDDLPTLRPIFIVLRHCLHIRNLNDTFSGGIGSYTLYLMVVTALKTMGKAHKTLANQLLHVLDYWATFDTYNVGSTVGLPGTFAKKRHAFDATQRNAYPAQIACLDTLRRHYPKKPYLLCLQDPANYAIDLGKNIYSIKHVQRTFGHLHQQLESLLSDNENGDAQQMPSTKDSILAPLLKADYSQFEKQRSRAEQSFDPDFAKGRRQARRDMAQEAVNRAEAYKNRLNNKETVPDGERQELLIRRYQCQKSPLIRRTRLGNEGSPRVHGRHSDGER